MEPMGGRGFDGFSTDLRGGLGVFIDGLWLFTAGN